MTQPGKITVDFGMTQVLPNGVYRSQVAIVTVRDSQSSDFPFLEWELNVLDSEYKNRTLYYRTSLHPNALFRLEDQLIELGILKEEGVKFEFEFDPESRVVTSPALADMVVNAQVRIDVYKGKKRNYVDFLTRAQEAPALSIDVDKGTARIKGLK